jgi:CTP synthase (UTP-ammonia lyase)
MIGLIGDPDPGVAAHREIPRVLAELGARHRWLATGEVRVDAEVTSMDGLWCVPGSPYRYTDAALAMIRIAREQGIPFLGTCGGFQHALIEYARSVAGIEDAEHAESSPSAERLVIEPLSCSLVGMEGPIQPLPGTLLESIYGEGEHRERYHCSYGLAPGYRHLTESGCLRAAALDDQGELRAVEIPGPNFWLATLFQPELSSPPGCPHPVIAAFVAAAGTPAVHFQT